MIPTIKLTICSICHLILTVVLWAWTLVEVALVLALISLALILVFAALHLCLRLPLRVLLMALKLGTDDERQH